MNEVFETRNDLERQLEAAQAGKIPGEEFLNELLLAQVFMPVKDTKMIGGLQTDRGVATPLTVEVDGVGQVIMLFTSPERAKSIVKDYPNYTGGLLVEFQWVLERIGGGVGISLNPGWDVGMDMEPDMVAQLASARPQKPNA